MSRDLGRDVPDLEKLYARKLGADFSYPTFPDEDFLFLRVFFFAFVNLSHLFQGS